MGFGMGFIAAALVRIKEQENGSDTGIGPNLESLTSYENLSRFCRSYISFHHPKGAEECDDT
jgi:hypothetical protein